MDYYNYILYILEKKIRPVPYGNIIVSIIISIAILALPMFSIAMVLWTFVFIFLISAVYYLRNVIKKWFEISFTTIHISLYCCYLWVCNVI